MCFYRVCFASIYFSAILKIPTRVFSNAGAGYTFYPLSINRVGFFVSVNREKFGCFRQLLCVLISSYELAHQDSKFLVI